VRRAVATVALLALATTGLAGCGNREEVRDELLAALRRTDALSYKYVYVDDRPSVAAPGAPAPRPDVQVQGLVQDDVRFKARVTVAKAPAFDEVVSDDLLAMRFLEPARLTPLINQAKVGEVDTKTDVDGVDSVTALESRRWVVDETAAPGVTVGRVDEATLGDDPVLDSITALTYVETAIREAQSVEKFSKDSVSPAYSASEDDFPKPEDGSGVTRYDLRRPKLPPPGQNQAAGGQSGRPQTRHFRRMAVYVKGGRVIQVREAIDLKGKFLRDVLRYARTYARASGASSAEIDKFIGGIEAAPDDQQGPLVLAGLSLALASSGDAPILQRRMTLDLRDLGGDIAVELPTQDVVHGGLGFLIVTSTGKPEADGTSGENSGASGSTTTTTAAGTTATTAASTDPAATSTASTEPAPVTSSP
jgi:hypothetical protein